ncbi:hypothetical protein DPM19_18460 [Actinomadura craniellae]|uniref:Lipoprotein n=1 Tax=Actinomadura craniellae TaxID=2231787 RepID=A0A365H4A1_9ACTN|nr:hypothetical protein [Actinomadura craniellae]RAY13836.1 hypothetical protein DPM19_18460 [Actinomadura craniellae]
MEARRWAVPAAVAISATLLLTACGQEPAGKRNVAAGSTPTAEPSADPSDPPSQVTLVAAEDPKLGRIVVDGAGRTLYRFDKDTPKPPKTACLGDCAKTWPPVTSTDVSVKNLDGRLVGEVIRPDGTRQVTLNGWPLYRYIKDTAPGQLRGQGVGGTWFVAAPNGKKAGVVQTSPSPRPTPSPVWRGRTALRVVNDPTLGKVVVDGQGRTLYRFDKDTPRPPVSNCLGACAKTWPPVTWTKNMTLTGIDRGAIGNMMRKDGICQVTLNGWPLYRYIKDTRPGDTLGQGVGGTWFVAAPNGKKAGGGTTTGGGY